MADIPKVTVDLTGKPWAFRETGDNVWTLVADDDGGQNPEPPVTTIANVSAAVIIPSDGTAPNEVPYDASYTLTPAVWTWLDADGVTQTSETASVTIQREWLLDGVVVSTTATLAAGDNTRIGQTLRYRERAQDPVTDEWSPWVAAADITPIRDQDTTPLPPDSLQILDGDWGMMPGQYVNASDEDVFLPNPGPTDKWVPRFWIKFSDSGYGAVDPSGVPIFAVEWGAGSAVPIPEANFEPAEFEQTLADGRHVYRFSLRDKTGDRWDLVPRPNGVTDFDVTIRTKFEETQAWPAEATPRKFVVAPPPVQKPAAVVGWTVAPHTSGTDGRITITIPSGQPSDWGDGTAGSLQWYNSSDGWQAVPSLTFSPTLPAALHGQTVEIRVRGVSSEGINGTGSAQSVAVPGTVTVREVWRQVIMPGISSKNQGTGPVYREGHGGELYQFFHGAAIFYNPGHAQDGKIMYATMDVHAGWVCADFDSLWPVLMAPAFEGIKGRHGMSVQVDREQPNRVITMTAAHSASSRGGLWTSTDYNKTISHFIDSHPTARVGGANGIEFIGGQFGGGTSQWRAWSRLIVQDRNNLLRWIAIGPRRSNRGGIILRSSDRGEMWSHAGNVNQAYIYTLQQMADGRLIYGSENGLHIADSFTSNDFGSGSWPAGIPSGQRTELVGIECHPTDARYGYCATYNGGVYRTDDGFQTVTPIGLHSNGYCNVFASPWNFNNVAVVAINKDLNVNDIGRWSAFSSNGLQGAAFTGTSGSPNWTELTNDRHETRTYGHPSGDGDTQIKAPGSSARSARQMQCAFLFTKNEASNHRRCFVFQKGAHATSDNGVDWRRSGDGVDHTGSGQYPGSLVFSSSHPEHSYIAGFDNKDKVSHDNHAFWESGNRGEVSVCAALAPNRPNGDWGCVVNAYYAPGELYYSKNMDRAGGPTWTDSNISGVTFVSFSNGSGGQNRLWTDQHRCTNFGNATPTFQSLTNSQGFNSSCRMFAVSATDPLVAYAVNGSQVIRTDNGGNSFYNYCNTGDNFGRAICVDPKNHDIIEWYDPTRGVRRYNGSSFSTVDGSVAGINGGNVANSYCICPASDTSYFFYERTREGRFGVMRRKGNNPFTQINDGLTQTAATRGMDICPRSGILYTLGTSGTRYFPPPVINSVAEARLAVYREYERRYGGEETLAIL